MQRRGLGDLPRVLTSDVPRVVSGVAIETVWAASAIAAKVVRRDTISKG